MELRIRGAESDEVTHNEAQRCDSIHASQCLQARFQSLQHSLVQAEHDGTPQPVFIAKMVAQRGMLNTGADSNLSRGGTRETM
jgi:hypothetical protein